MSINDRRPMNEESSTGQFFRGFFWIVLPLVLGAYLAWAYVPPARVGLVRLESDIWAGSVEFVKLQLEEVRQDPSIRAVVLVIDSPGGEVAPTQDMFMEILSLRQEMPVVVSINSMAASGGYYLALAGEYIYAKPNSTIGNVGVWGYVPDALGVNEQVLASGPFKLTASNRDEFQREIEGIKQEFIQTVTIYRGERLSISPIALSQGLAYPGRQALEYGMIDVLGSQEDAARKAAELARIANYEVVDLQYAALKRLLAQYEYLGRPWQLSTGQQASAEIPAEAWFLQPWVGAANPQTGLRQLPPGFYLLYDVRLGGAK